MAVELIMTPEAEDDVSEGYAYFEGRRVGRGEEFLEAVDACIRGILRTP